MRKILLFLVMALTLTAITSCKDVKPRFKFQLALNGEVADSVTAVQGDFDVNVCNNVVVFQTINDTTEVLSIASPEGNDANNWLDNYIQTNVISEFANSTEYVINVKGYVYETLTGITFSVDKTFTNKTN
jgi:hypothetical protein